MPRDRARAGVTAATVLVPSGGLAAARLAARHRSPASKRGPSPPAETARSPAPLTATDCPAALALVRPPRPD